jgi:hypothetical protein
MSLGLLEGEAIFSLHKRRNCSLLGNSTWMNTLAQSFANFFATRRFWFWNVPDPQNTYTAVIDFLYVSFTLEMS